jgi:hypothetical protein
MEIGRVWEERISCLGSDYLFLWFWKRFRTKERWMFVSEEQVMCKGRLKALGRC